MTGSSLIVSDQALRLIATPHPLRADVVDRYVEPGGTIIDLMDAVGVERVTRTHAIVFITDRAMCADPVIVPRANWARVKPKPGMLVSIRVAPGKGGGKSPLATVLTIGVMVASFAYGGGLGLAMGLDGAVGSAFTIGAWQPSVAGLVGGGLIPLSGHLLVSSTVAPT